MLGLRDHYNFAQWYASQACDLLASRVADPGPAVVAAQGHADADLAAQTVQFFEEISQATGNELLAESIGQLNALLGPVRPAEIALIADAPLELSNLQEAWRRRDLKALRTALSDYLDRRTRLAPRIAALLAESPATRRR